jgi:hypothetical protein
MKVIDQNGFVQFRGDCKTAKKFFGDGTKVNIIVDEDGEPTGETEEYTFTLVYEEPADDMQYLADTDWYVVREQETGKPMPVEVRAKRSEIRART